MCILNKFPGNTTSPSLGTALENLGEEVTAVVTGKAVLGTSSHQTPESFT